MIVTVAVGAGQAEAEVVIGTTGVGAAGTQGLIVVFG